MGRENGNRPLVTYHSCQTCGYQRMQYADLPDVQALCRNVLDKALRASGTPDKFDYDNAIGHLAMSAWELYLGWDPSVGVRFTAYASGLLPNRFKDLQRTQLGRDNPKPHAYAVSLDAPIGDDEGDLLSYLAAATGDPSENRSPDLARLLRPLFEADGELAGPLPDLEGGGALGGDSCEPRVFPRRRRRRPRTDTTVDDGADPAPDVPRGADHGGVGGE